MTTRPLTAALLSEIQTGKIHPILLGQFEFASGTVRLWSGYGNLSWNGYTWVGGGKIIGISDLSETANIVANGVTVTMSGVDPSDVSTVLANAEQNRPGKIWFGVLDSSGNVVADPFQVFSGTLDVPSIEDDGTQTCRITLSYENRLAILLRPAEARYTHEYQQQLYPGDLGLEYVSSIQEKEIKWGKR